MLPLLLPYCCQAPTETSGPFLWRISCSSMGTRRADERPRTADPISLRVIHHALQRVANAAYLGGFLCSGLQSVAPYYAPGGIRVVSMSPRIRLRRLSVCGSRRLAPAKPRRKACCRKCASTILGNPDSVRAEKSLLSDSGFDPGTR
jgi:hypothetical protein